MYLDGDEYTRHRLRSFLTQDNLGLGFDTPYVEKQDRQTLEMAFESSPRDLQKT